MESELSMSLPMPEAVGELLERLSGTTHLSLLSFCRIVLDMDMLPSRTLQQQCSLFLLALVALCLDSPLQQLGRRRNLRSIFLGTESSNISFSLFSRNISPRLSALLSDASSPTDLMDNLVVSPLLNLPVLPMLPRPRRSITVLR